MYPATYTPESKLPADLPGKGRVAARLGRAGVMKLFAQPEHSRAPEIISDKGRPPDASESGPSHEPANRSEVEWAGLGHPREHPPLLP
jgi:hypothetical protein